MPLGASVREVGFATMGGVWTERVFVPAREQPYVYDQDGNLTRDGIWEYVWDAENRLIRMTMLPAVAERLLASPAGQQPWLTIEFGYDHLHRRVSKRVLASFTDSDTIKEKGEAEYAFESSYWEKTVYDTGTFNPLLTYRADPQTGDYQSPWRSYVWGPDLSGTLTGAGGIGGLAVTFDDFADAGGGSGYVGPLFPTYDGNGNLMRLYDTAREVRAQYEYGPFGEGRSLQGPQASANPVRFSSKAADAETGLVYYGYRYYSPMLGRWVSRDPIEERDGVNVYAYVGNAPASSLDVLGMWRFVPDVGVFSGAFGPTPVSRTGSAFSLIFTPDRSYFECIDCKKIEFVQIYRAEYDGVQRVKQNEVDYSGNWVIDAHVPPFYPYGNKGSPGRGAPSDMEDTPMLQINWLSRRLPYWYLKEYETCAVCSTGSARGQVYGCVRWSHLFTGGQVIADAYWARKFVSRGQLIEWSSDRSDQFYEWRRPPWFNRSIQRDLVLKSVGGVGTPTLGFSWHEGLNPTSNMQVFLNRYLP